MLRLSGGVLPQHFLGHHESHRLKRRRMWWCTPVLSILDWCKCHWKGMRALFSFGFLDLRTWGPFQQFSQFTQRVAFWFASEPGQRTNQDLSTSFWCCVALGRSIIFSDFLVAMHSYTGKSMYLKEQVCMAVSVKTENEVSTIHIHPKQSKEMKGWNFNTSCRYLNLLKSKVIAIVTQGCFFA